MFPTVFSRKHLFVKSRISIILIAVLIIFNINLSTLAGTGTHLLSNDSSANSIDNKMRGVLEARGQNTNLDQWLTFQAGATHHGNSTSIAPIDSGILWEASAQGRIFSSPTVNAGNVYFGDTNWWIYSLDIDTGFVNWNFHVSKYTPDGKGGGGVDTALTINNGRIFFGCDDNYVYSINEADGSKGWRFQTTGQLKSTPIVSGGNVFVASMKGTALGNSTVYAINEITGALVWKFNVSNHIKSTPAVANGLVYIGSEDGKLYALDETTGAEQWNFTTGGMVKSSPTVDSGMVYFGSADKKFYAIDATTGVEQWNRSFNGIIKSSAAIAYDDVFITTMSWDTDDSTKDGGLFALNKFNGAQKWGKKLSGTSESSPAVAEGKVYAAAGNYFYCFEIATQELLWEKEVPDADFKSSPAIANGRLFIGTTGSPYKLLAFGAPDFVIDTADISIPDNDIFVDEFVTLTVKVKNIGSIDGNGTVTFSHSTADKTFSKDIKQVFVEIPARNETVISVEWQVDENPNPDEKLWIMYFNISGVLPGEPNSNNLQSKTLQYNLRNYSDWQMFQNNFAHTGFADGGAQSDRIIWQNSSLTPAAVGGSVVYSSGKVYVNTLGGKVQSFNKESGQPLEEFNAPGTLTNTPAMFIGEDVNTFNSIFVSSKEGKIYSIEMLTGATKWTYDIGKAVYTSPVDYFGMVLVGSSDGYLYALDEDGFDDGDQGISESPAAGAGDLVWRLDLGGPIGSSTPAISTTQGNAYIGTLSNELVAVDLRTGSINWTLTAGGPIQSAPTIVNDMIIFGSNDTKLYALDLQGFSDGDNGAVDSDTTLTNGDILWTAQLTGSPGSSSAAVDANEPLIYIGTATGEINAVEMISGTLNWTFDLGTTAVNSPSVGTNGVYFTASDGKLYAINKFSDVRTNTASLLWNFSSTTGENMVGSPAVYGNRVFCGDEAGWVYALGAPNLEPVAVIASPLNGSIYSYDQDIEFDATGSSDPDDVDLTYTWTKRRIDKSFDEVIYKGPAPSFTSNITSGGDYIITLTVSDYLGATDSAKVNITVYGKPDDPDTPDIWEFKIREYREDTIPARCLIEIGGPGQVTMLSRENPGEASDVDLSVNKFVSYRFANIPGEPFKISWTNITIGFAKSDVMHNMNISRIRMFYYDGGWVRIPLSGVTILDETNVEVWANFTRLINTTPMIFAPGTFDNTPPVIIEPFDGPLAVQPLAGGEFDQFTFRVKYRDNDADPATDGGWVKVFIDGQTFYMGEATPQTANYGTYVDFILILEGTVIGLGTHNVSFAAHDGTIQTFEVLSIAGQLEISASRPTAEAGPDIQVKADKEFTVDGSGSSDPNNDISYFYWDFDSSVDRNGDGDFTNDRDKEGTIATWRYTTAGTFTVTLTVEDAGGATDTDSLTVTVTAAPDAGDTSDLGEMLTVLAAGIIIIVIAIIFAFLFMASKRKEEKELERISGEGKSVKKHMVKRITRRKLGELGEEEFEVFEESEEHEALPEEESAEELEDGAIPESHRLMPPDEDEDELEDIDEDDAEWEESDEEFEDDVDELEE
jgi:outer membrane protein assembly factor BamB